MCSRIAISGPARRSTIGWNAGAKAIAGQRLSQAMRRSCSSLWKRSPRRIAAS
jgi:hypothetical protein